MSVSENTKEKIGHRACVRGVIGSSYPIYACAVVANFPLIYYLAVYMEMPLLLIPYCVHSVALTHQSIHRFDIIAYRSQVYISCIPLHSYANKIEHYRIRTTDDGKLTVDDEVVFESLFEFVEVRRVFILRCIIISAPV